MNFLSRAKYDFRGKTAILRVDLNIEDNYLSPNHPRISGILPTIKSLRGAGSRVVIVSHRGRPSKKDDHWSLKPMATILSKAIKTKVNFLPYESLTSRAIKKTRNKIQNSPSNSVWLAENIRFFKEEGENDEKFAKRLSDLADFYVNDAFSVSHRKAASLCAINKCLPGLAGILLENEIARLSGVMKNPAHPLVVILGGAKISDKIGLIKNFLNKADKFLMGGGIANTFFYHQGLPVGDSLHEKDVDPRIFQKYIGQKIILPRDTVVEKRKILDIGPKTANEFSEIIDHAATIIWNGPMGYFENKKFAQGTKAIADAVLNNKKAEIVIGGGETSSLFIGKKSPKNIFVSTGGGAMLEFLAGKILPGLEALDKNKRK